MSSATLPYPPQTRDDLWLAVRALFKVTIPRAKVCPDHCAPFDAFADAYFRECTIEDGPPRPISRAIWHASRGLAGKSFMLSTLGLLFAYVDGADITILGGSMAQSSNVHAYMVSGMESGGLPLDMVLDQSTLKIQLTNKGRVRPLPASQRTVRGPHPSVLLLDEVDEMELSIYDAALGQPMPQPGYLGNQIDTMTVVSSTWQRAEGCVKINTPILTSRGYVPIQGVRVGDQVPTRSGWRAVTNVIDTGQQECVRIELASGRALVCTPWHPIWTDAAGWVRADALAVGAHVVTLISGVASPELDGSIPNALPTPPLAAGTLPRAGEREVVPVVAGGLGLLDGERSLVVDPRSDWLQVAGIDTGRAGASSSADVIERQVVRDRPVDLHPDPAMSEEHSSSRDEVAIALAPIAVVVEVERPDDAVVGVQIDGYIFAQDEVVNVHHAGRVLPTWDLTVEDTHEYVANGILVHNTLTEIFRRNEELETPNPIYKWCYLENHVDNNPTYQVLLDSDGSLKTVREGWLAEKTIQEKRDDISAEMFRVEYDLGEPSAGNRAMDSDKVREVFCGTNLPIWELHRKDWDEWRFFEREPNAVYASGADWAKEQDKTVISIIRTDLPKRQLVYTARINRTNYPVMIGLFNKAQNYYGVGLNGSWHDSTGLGNVVNDYVDQRARAFSMTGDKRTTLLSDYVNAIEKVTWVLPKMLRKYYTEHLYCSTGDLYSNKQEFHLPDTVCSFALAEYGAKRVVNAAAPIGVAKDGVASKLAQHFQHPSDVAHSLTGPDPDPAAAVINLAVGG